MTLRSPYFATYKYLSLMLCIFFWLNSSANANQLDRFLDRVEPVDLHPEAIAFGIIEQTAPIIPLLGEEGPVGWAFLNSDFTGSIGYSGKPIHIMIGLDPSGTISGLKLVKHYEPIVLVGIPESDVKQVVDGYRGLNVLDEIAAQGEGHELDIISGATVTIIVIDDSIVRSSIKVARSLGLGGLTGDTASEGPIKTINPDLREQRSWETLLGDGSIRRMLLDVGSVSQAFADKGDAEAAANPEDDTPESIFIDLYTGLVTVPTIGESILGQAEYNNLTKRLAEGDQALFVAGLGAYSFKGSGYVRGGIFDRIQLVQGDISIRFRDRQHKRLGSIAADGAPDVPELALFTIPADSGFDPTKPWRLQLLVNRQIGPTEKAFLTYDLDYQIPDQFLNIEPAAPVVADHTPAIGEADFTPQEPAPLWQTIWLSKQLQIAVLLTALAILTIGFFFQMQLARYPKLIFWGRIGFLTFTLVWLGWWANAQLSVVNVMTFTGALLSGFSWNYFLMDPLIFILWFSVAASVIFWGRGAYCGWLCPFGALQELTNRLAKWAKIPQWHLPWGLHERLWPLKYIIFLLLFGLSLYSLDTAEHWAEVEPFKTAIILKFVREWPFVVFALVLLAIGLFIERFYCRYLCPLGAALAIPGRIRMFEWLKRYRDCGNPCQVCAKECMVQAIHPEGQINPNECLYCLHCQVVYVDDHKCPVCVRQRLKKARQKARSGASSKPVLDKSPQPT